MNRGGFPDFGESKCSPWRSCSGACFKQTALEAVKLKIASFLPTIRMVNLHFYSERGCRLTYRCMHSCSMSFGNGVNVFLRGARRLPCWWKPLLIQGQLLHHELMSHLALQSPVFLLAYNDSGVFPPMRRASW